MSSSKQVCLALVTAPEMKTARRLAKVALKRRLAACANLIPRLESYYWWQGNLEHSAEVLMVFKTTRRLRHALEKLIVEAHPYDTPEFIVLGIEQANARYLDWWLNSCRK